MFSSSNLNPLRQSLPQTQNTLHQAPTSLNHNSNNKSLLKIDNFLPSASLANAVNNSTAVTHPQLFDLNAFPSSRNSLLHQNSHQNNLHQNSNLITHHLNHNSSRNQNVKNHLTYLKVYCFLKLFFE